MANILGIRSNFPYENLREIEIIFENAFTCQAGVQMDKLSKKIEV